MVMIKKPGKHWPNILRGHLFHLKKSDMSHSMAKSCSKPQSTMTISRKISKVLMFWIHLLICMIGTQRSCDFIALVTAHIPPKHKQYIRRYGRLCNTPYSNYNWKQRSCKVKKYSSRSRSPHSIMIKEV